MEGDINAATAAGQDQQPDLPITGPAQGPSGLHTQGITMIPAAPPAAEPTTAEQMAFLVAQVADIARENNALRQALVSSCSSNNAMFQSLMTQVAEVNQGLQATKAHTTNIAATAATAIAAPGTSQSYGMGQEFVG